jgi:hypothetical protein
MQSDAEAGVTPATLSHAGIRAFIALCRCSKLFSLPRHFSRYSMRFGFDLPPRFRVSGGFFVYSSGMSSREVPA